MTISAAYPADFIVASSLPDLDEFGLLPPGVYDTTIEEIRDRFCFNNDRIEILARFEEYAARLSVFGIQFSYFLDGSFLSSQPNPGDIDVAVDIPDVNTPLFTSLKKSAHWSDAKWLIMDRGRVIREFSIHFFTWSPKMQTGGPNDAIHNFQTIYAATAVKIQANSGKKVDLNQKKGIVRVIL